MVKMIKIVADGRVNLSFSLPFCSPNENCFSEAAYCIENTLGHLSLQDYKDTFIIYYSLMLLFVIKHIDYVFEYSMFSAFLKLICSLPRVALV